MRVPGLRDFLRRFSRHEPERSGKSEKKWREVDDYIADLLVPADPGLEPTLESSQAAGLPQINVSPNQGKLLMLLAKAINSRAILEIGTLAGYSSIWLARALTLGGFLITIEADPSRAEIARANIARAGLAETVDVRQGRALDVLPSLLDDGPFDFVHIDADVANSAEYFRWALKLSRVGGLIMVDNVIRHGSIIDSENRKPEIQGLRQFYEFVAAQPNVIMTAIQTVGSKGYDGFAVALVVADPSKCL